MHSGCSGGKKWRIVVYEATKSVPIPVIDTQVIAKQKFGCLDNGWLRPVRAWEELIDELDSKGVIDEDKLYLYPTFKGLQRIGKFLGEPLVFGKKEVDKK